MLCFPRGNKTCLDNLADVLVCLPVRNSARQSMRLKSKPLTYSKSFAYPDCLEYKSRFVKGFFAFDIEAFLLKPIEQLEIAFSMQLPNHELDSSQLLGIETLQDFLLRAFGINLDDINSLDANFAQEVAASAYRHSDLLFVSRRASLVERPATMVIHTRRMNHRQFAIVIRQGDLKALDLSRGFSVAGQHREVVRYRFERTYPRPRIITSEKH